MIQRYGILGNFNPDVEKDVKMINEEIANEKAKENPDKERLMKLAEEAMVKGLRLNVGYTRNYGQFGLF